MKKIFPFIIICGIVGGLPVSLVSQTKNATLKPATDACPSWNKKQTVASKADYFAYLSKREKAKDQADFNTPKYQNIVAGKPVSPTEERRNRGAAAPKIARTQTPAGVTEKDKKVEAPKETPIVKTDAKTDDEFETTKKEDTTKKTEAPVKEKGKTSSASGKMNKQADQNKKTPAVNQQRKHLLKNMFGRRKHAADCPSF